MSAEITTFKAGFALVQGTGYNLSSISIKLCEGENLRATVTASPSAEGGGAETLTVGDVLTTVSEVDKEAGSVSSKADVALTVECTDEAGSGTIALMGMRLAQGGIDVLSPRTCSDMVLELLHPITEADEVGTRLTLPHTLKVSKLKEIKVDAGSLTNTLLSSYEGYVKATGDDLAAGVSSKKGIVADIKKVDGTIKDKLEASIKIIKQHIDCKLPIPFKSTKNMDKHLKNNAINMAKAFVTDPSNFEPTLLNGLYNNLSEYGASINTPMEKQGSTVLPGLVTVTALTPYQAITQTLDTTSIERIQLPTGAAALKGLAVTQGGSTMLWNTQVSNLKKSKKDTTKTGDAVWSGFLRTEVPGPIKRVYLPGWLSSFLSFGPTKLSLKPVYSTGDQAKYVAKKGSPQKEITKLSGKYCEDMYFKLYNSGYKVKLTCELLLIKRPELTTGERINITEDGKDLFSCYITAITHEISIERQTAQTVIIGSYVQYANADSPVTDQTSKVYT